MNIYDCFMYFDEDLLLDLRLNTLNKFVKKFVITEATYTHNGSKKNLKFDIKKFSKFKDKIKLPYVFIGGINHTNIKKLITFRPNNVAIIDSLWNFKQGPVQSALKFKEKLEAT